MNRRIAAYCVIAVIVAVSAALTSLYGCSSEQRHSVLFICVDTLRPDRLGYAGNQRDTSPTIDGLAADGVVFENTYSVSGWTLPSMATMFTGRYPRDHGATDFHWAVDAALPTLAGILRREGYDTRAYVSHVILKPQYGLADGFKSYDYSVLNVGHPHDVATAEQLTNKVIGDLSSIEKPFFIWVHYFDPHFAYLPHGPWASFGDTDIDRYDQEIAHTDYQIGRLLDALERRGLDDNTIVIFNSDHGEEFGEHEGKFHYTLYEEVLRTPLVIKAPFLEPQKISAVVEQIDFLPTVLGMLDLEASGEFPGRDVFATTGTAGPVFFERDRPPPWVQRGVIHDNHKLIVIELADTTKVPLTSRGTYSAVTNVHPGIYMYDLASDPGESNNIYSQSNARAQELLGLLAGHFAADRPSVHNVEIDEELKRKLRSLGYIR
jgi:arylsulfatase A-like enzyme